MKVQEIKNGVSFLTEFAAERLKDSKTPLQIHYKNWNGIFSMRKIIPDYVWFGMTEFHQTPQYLLHAWDIGKNAYRDFAIVDILEFIKDGG